MAFLLPYESKPPYSGPVRPFVIFTKYINNSVLLLYKPQYNITEQYSKYLGDKVVVLKEFSDIIRYLRTNSIDFILTTDYYKALLFLRKLKYYCQIKQQTVIYAEVYHGTLNPFNIKSRITFRIISRLLKSFRCIVANSITGYSFLINYYNIKPSGYTYPPVDTAIFKPIRERSNTNNVHNILLYVGSIKEDTNLKAIINIIKTLLKRGDIGTIYLLGNKALQLKLVKIFGISRIHPLLNISDEQLAKIYTSVSLTICPQKWEPYGYVVAESITCSTPVLALNLMGPKELISLSKCGLLADTEEHLISLIEWLDFTALKNKCRNYIVQKLISPEACINKLVNILRGASDKSDNDV